MARLAPDQVFRLFLLDLGEAITHEGIVDRSGIPYAEAEWQLNQDGHPITKPDVRTLIDAARVVYAEIRRAREVQ